MADDAVWTGRTVFPLPVGSCRLTSRFGPRRHPVSGNQSEHTGVDLSAPPGTPVLAFRAGRVVRVDELSEVHGGLVVLAHDDVPGGLESWYAHQELAEVVVREGQDVSAGAVLGAVGSSGRANGPHLHFELHVGDPRAVVDPGLWVDEHDPEGAAVWRVVASKGRSRRRLLRRALVRRI